MHFSDEVLYLQTVSPRKISDQTRRADCDVNLYLKINSKPQHRAEIPLRCVDKIAGRRYSPLRLKAGCNNLIESCPLKF